MVLARDTCAILVFSLSASEPVVHERIAETDRLFRLGHNHRDGLLCTRFLLVFCFLGGVGVAELGCVEVSCAVGAVGCVAVADCNEIGVE